MNLMSASNTGKIKNLQQPTRHMKGVIKSLWQIISHGETKKLGNWHHTLRGSRLPSLHSPLSILKKKDTNGIKKRPSKCYIPFPKNDPFDWLAAWSYSRPPYALTLSKLIFGFLYIEDTDCMSGYKTNYFGAILAASARTTKIHVSGRPCSHASGFRRAANQSGWIWTRAWASCCSSSFLCPLFLYH